VEKVINPKKVKALYDNVIKEKESIVKENLQE
jgi:hypothetical protein